MSFHDSDTNTEFQRLNRLLEAATLLNSTLEPREITEIILQIVRDQVPVERVTAFRVDRKRGLLRSLVAQEAGQEIALPIGSGIAGTVAATGELLDIPDAYADPRFNSDFDRVLKYRTRDLFALPVFNRHGDISGVIELLNRKRPIDSADLEFLQRVSVYIGLALENASAYQEAVAGQAEKDLVVRRDRLAHTDRMASMAQAFHGVMHHINNPLAIVMGCTGLLQVRCALDARGIEYTRTIEAAARRAADALRSFAHAAGSGMLRYEPVDAVQLLLDVVELRAPGWERMNIDTVIDVHPASLIGDSKLLQVAFMHLLANAEDACSGREVRGSIKIRSSSDPERQCIRIEVEDNGPGIPAEIHQRLFEPFFTTKPEGTAIGLGLAIVQEVAQSHQGHVSFETTPEMGTIFALELPVVVEKRSRIRLHGSEGSGNL